MSKNCLINIDLATIFSQMINKFM